MPRAPHKVRITELDDDRFCITPIIQSTPRRSREFETADAAMRHLWALLTTTDLLSLIHI